MFYDNSQQGYMDKIKKDAQKLLELLRDDDYKKDMRECLLISRMAIKS